MTESELMAQFRREYCNEFPQESKRIGTFNWDSGSYVDLKIEVAYQMWKRAKLETRTVTLNVNELLFMTSTEQVLKTALEKINARVEFV